MIFGLIGLVMSAASLQPGSPAAACRTEQEKVFAGDGERVRLARGDGLGTDARLALFKAPLAVNTDGAPTSYHPDDYRGRRIVLNHIENGITIRRVDGTAMTSAQREAVFDRWRASSSWAVPAGYRISWQNVIAADAQGRPCVFSQGEHKGYFGSLTATRNGVSAAQAGECLIKDQLDQRYIPAIVLRDPANNPLTTFGAGKGDLVLAVNSAVSPPAIVAAIIGDTGDAKRIGEGSVALNMQLLGEMRQPANYREAVRLDTGRREMIVAVLPGTRSYRLQRPYSADNIRQRVAEWAAEEGYGSLENLAAALASCAQGL